MIAIEKVRHYGEAVAAVIAENRYIAEDACDLIEVDYEQLPVVLDPFAAREEGSAARPREDRARTSPTSARSRSARSTRRSRRPTAPSPAKLYWPRSTGMPMDTNGAIGDYDRGTGVLTIYANSMNFTYFLWLIAASLKIPAEQAPARAGRGGRQLRLEVLHAQGADASRGSSRCSPAAR